MVVAGRKGNHVFTLEGADHAYRVLIESMNEGALTLTSDHMVLFANQCFAKMVKSSLEQVIGSSFLRFLGPGDQLKLRPPGETAGTSGTKFQATLIARDGSQLPAQISIQRQLKNGPSGATIGMVVTDITEARRTEGLLRALAHRVVQVQETERQRVGFELHDNITQLLCAVAFRSQSLIDNLPADSGTSRGDAEKLRDMLGNIAEEVVRISHNLGPVALRHVGLVTALGDVRTEFADHPNRGDGKAHVPASCRTIVGRHGTRIVPDPPGRPAKRGEARESKQRFRSAEAGGGLACGS